MRSQILFCALFGLTGVALGAAGAHALADYLGHRDMLAAWETAVRFQLIHAVAMFSSLAWQASTGRIQSAQYKWLARANGCWTVGIGLFCGSLYGLALGGPHWLGPVTPLGGLALLAGWSCLAVQAWAFAPVEKKS